MNEEVRALPVGTETGIQLSAEPQLRAISDRYAARGLHKAVLDTAAEQIHKEEETRALAPDAYRLSLLSDVTVNSRYRLGKCEMASADLVRYFCDTRNRRIRNMDFTGNTGIDVCTGTNEKQPVSQTSEKKQKNDSESGAKSLSKQIKAQIARSFPTWFNAEKPDTSKEVKRFPLSAFAALVAVAMSLMLIVASSVLLTRAEKNISELKSDVDTLSEEVADLRSDLNVRNNLLEIRRIAIEEYGMVDENYVKMQYIALDNQDTVEVFEEKREETVGLSALLSAIGIK